MHMFDVRCVYCTCGMMVGIAIMIALNVDQYPGAGACTGGTANNVGNARYRVHGAIHVIILLLDLACVCSFSVVSLFPRTRCRIRRSHMRTVHDVA